MFKCDCCGDKKAEGQKITVGKGFSAAEVVVCSECINKINAVGSGSLNPESVITPNTVSKLAESIKNLANNSGNISGEVIASYDSSKDSGIGSAIKVISVIVIILSVIGSFVLMGIEGTIGIASLIVSALIGTVCYGIGEICCLLKSIDSKL